MARVASVSPKLHYFRKKLMHSDVRQSTTKKILASIAATFCALVIALIVACSVCGTWKSFGGIVKTIFTAGFQKDFVNSLLSNMAIMITAGLAFIFAYKAGLFNIGISGQMVMGGTIATVLCHCKDYVDESGNWVVQGIAGPGGNQILILLASMAAAAAIAALVGALKAFLNVNEVVSSIMFNWIIYYMSILILSSMVIAKDSSGLATLSPSDNLIMRMNGQSFGPLLIMTGIIVVFVAVVIKYTVFGKKQRVTGLSRTGALASGYNVKANMISSMAISGAIAGVLGVMVYAGFNPQMPLTAASKAIPQEGFNGISVGLIAMCNPIATLPVGLFFSMVQTSVSNLQLLGIDNHIAQVVFGIVVYGSAAIGLFLQLKPYWFTIGLFKGAKYSKIKHERNKANIALLELANDHNEHLKKYYIYNQKEIHIKCAIDLTAGQKFKMFMADIRYHFALMRSKIRINRNTRYDIYSNMRFLRQDMVHIVYKNNVWVVDNESAHGGCWLKPTVEALKDPKLAFKIQEVIHYEVDNKLLREVKKAGWELVNHPADTKQLRLIPLLSYLQNLRTGLTYRYDIANQNLLDKESLNNIRNFAALIGLPEIKTRAQYQIAFAAYIRAYDKTQREIKNHFDRCAKQYGSNSKANRKIPLDILAIRYDQAKMEESYNRHLLEEVRRIRNKIDKPMLLESYSKKELDNLMKGE